MLQIQFYNAEHGGPAFDHGSIAFGPFECVGVTNNELIGDSESIALYDGTQWLITSNPYTGAYAGRLFSDFTISEYVEQRPHYRVSQTRIVEQTATHFIHARSMEEALAGYQQEYEGGVIGWSKNRVLSTDSPTVERIG